MAETITTMTRPSHTRNVFRHSALIGLVWIGLSSVALGQELPGRIAINGKVRVNSSSGLLSKLEVFDVMGKLVLVQPTKSFSEETDLSHFANGLYLLRAWVGGTYNTFKILKE